MYEEGQGVEKNVAKAKYYYEQACALNNSTALYNLGALYEDGQGIEKNLAKAKGYYEKSCGLGNGAAMTNLGCMYEDGLAVEKDLVKAKEYYEQACVLNNSTAMNNLGAMYQSGRGVKKDLAKAKKYYKKAGALGNVAALTNLGSMYKNSQGVKKNYIKAIICYEKAIASGGSDAMYLRAKMHEQGLGGQKNPVLACRLYYKAYSDYQYQEALKALQLLNEQNNIDAQLFLFYIALTESDNKTALSLYNKNHSFLISHFHSSPLPLIPTLINFLSKQSNQSLQLLAYLQFRQYLSEKNEQEALVLFSTHLINYPHVTADELFFMANRLLFANDETSFTQQDEESLTIACELLARGYLNEDDQNCYALLGQCLHILHALKTNQKPKGFSKAVPNYNQLANQFSQTYQLIQRTQRYLEEVNNLLDIFCNTRSSERSCSFFRRNIPKAEYPRLITKKKLAEEILQALDTPGREEEMALKLEQLESESMQDWKNGPN